MKFELHLAPHVVIIGGGFSGMMLAVNLIKQAAARLKISIIEKSEEIGKGIAYGTKDPRHLLNVFSEFMGAYADKPDDFYSWLVENEAEWRKLDPSFSQIELRKEVCMPRMVFSTYLGSIWKEAQSLAVSKGIEIHHLQQEAVNIFKFPNGHLCVACSNGKNVEADLVVLALGVPDNKEITLKSWLSYKDGYISNIWSHDPGNILSLPSFRHLKEDSQIVIIGSGLTTLDAFASLTEKGYRGQIICITATGKFPEVHRSNLEQIPPIIDPNHPPKSVLELLKATHYALKKAAASGTDWRCVIDSFRPVTVLLWRSYSWMERRKFLRCLINQWNLHRHRMSESSADTIEKQMAAGKLTLVPGYILYVDAGNQKPLKVAYLDKQARTEKEIEADYVLNCTGPKTNVNKVRSPLLRNLLDKHFVLPDPLDLGIQVTDHYEVKGEVKGKLYAVGLLLLGERFETIAVPELREQCAEAAERILTRL